MLLKVAAILPAMCADLPTPLKISLPPAAIAASTARAVPTNSAPSPREVSRRASPSIRMQCLARARADFGAMGINACCCRFGFRFESPGETGKFRRPIRPFNPFRLEMHTRSLLPGALALLVLVLWQGCGGDSLSLSSETDDPSYRDGLQLERQGRWDEALAAYLRVIDKRGDAAPESNLAAGVMYLNHTQNPIFAIYHFSKYLELEPNSKKAGMVRGMIDSAKREFARTLPGQPLESVTEHLGLEEQVERLQRENDDLKAENAALRAGVPVPVDALELDRPGCDPDREEPGRAARARSRPTRPRRSPSRPSSRADDRVRRSPTPRRGRARCGQGRGPGAARHHTVARGDTLFSLSLKYYGSRSRWRDIYAANRGRAREREHAAEDRDGPEDPLGRGQGLVQDREHEVGVATPRRSSAA